MQVFNFTTRFFLCMSKSYWGGRAWARPTGMAVSICRRGVFRGYCRLVHGWWGVPGAPGVAPLWCLASTFFDVAGLCFMRVAACYVLGAAAIAHGINISTFLKSWVVGQLVYTMFISNNRTSFHLWWKENLVKHRKVSKYHETDCSCIKSNE